MVHRFTSVPLAAKPENHLASAASYDIHSIVEWLTVRQYRPPDQAPKGKCHDLK